MRLGSEFLDSGGIICNFIFISRGRENMREIYLLVESQMPAMATTGLAQSWESGTWSGSSIWVVETEPPKASPDIFQGMHEQEAGVGSAMYPGFPMWKAGSLRIAFSPILPTVCSCNLLIANIFHSSFCNKF